MDLKQLDSDMKESLEGLKGQIKFDLETFDQSHDDDKLTKADMEQMGRQTYYAMSGMRDSLLKYLKENDR